MRKFAILFILFFTSIVMAVYTAPNEDTVIVVGGLGTQANKAQLNGGGATKTAWVAGTPSNFINTNGGPITNDTGINYDHVGGTPDRKLSKAGIGTGVIVGTLAYVSGTNITAGIYEITSVDGGGGWVACANIDATDDNADSVVNVGGALDTLQNALDEKVNNAASYNRYIYYNISYVSLAAPIDINQFSGSIATNILVEGWNSDLTGREQNTITTGSDINTLLNFNLGASHYIVFRYFIFDANGANKANYCAYGLGAADDLVTFENCLFDDAEDEAAISMNGDNWSVINCELKESGFGFRTGSNDGLYSLIINCSIHDNTNDGIFISESHSRVVNNKIYANGGIGINIATGFLGLFIVGNTLYGNSGDNLSINTDVQYGLVFNNTAVDSTGGLGFNLNGISPFTLLFGYNHSSSNDTAHYSEGADGTFADYSLGNNQVTTDPNDVFTTLTAGSEDFTPKSGSDLINNAFEFGGIGTLDIGAVQEVSGGNPRHGGKRAGKQ